MGRPAPPEAPGDCISARRQRALKTLHRAIGTPADGEHVFVFGSPILHTAHAGCLWQIARAEELSRDGTWGTGTLASYLDVLAETVVVAGLARSVGHVWAPSPPLGAVDWDAHLVLHEMYKSVAYRVMREAREASEP
jgi:hypothetical protein